MRVGPTKLRELRLSTAFGYQINSISEPLSELRQLAYTEGIPLFGPKEDPFGWKVLQTLKIKGTLSGKPVEVEITVSKPIPRWHGNKKY